MIGLGTITNTLAVAVGGLLGILLKKGLKENLQKILMKASGLAVLFIGVSGTLQYMLTVTNGALEVRGTMLLIFSLTIGSLLGEWMDIEEKMARLGERLKRLVRVNGENTFAEGFVNTSLIICVGAMAIVGSIRDGLTGDSSMLIAKSVLDFVIVMVNASAFGVGVVFSALPVFLYQGTLTLAAALCGSFISDGLIASLSFVGSALIFCVGVNTSFGKKFRVGNMLPALLVPVAYELLAALIH